MKKILKVLVTGAGSGVGQSIIKSLNLSKLRLEIISSDISLLNAGLYRTKKSFIVNKVEKKGSLAWYIKFLNKEKIDVLMIGSEYDVSFFSKNKKIIENKTKCNVCVCDFKTVQIAEDKYLTQEFLKNNNLPYLKTYIPKNFNDAKKKIKKLKLPVILKSRFGTSSRNVFLIKSLKDLHFYFKFVSKPIIQEHIGLENDNLNCEYTCSFFTTKNKKIIGPFVAKRKLVNGTSWIIEVKKVRKIENLIKRISKKINNVGSFNIQLRNGKKGPIPFEFNSRFSGTTSVRAHYGFNEPEMYLKNFIFNKEILNPKIKTGISFRYIEEIFIDNTNVNSLHKKFGEGDIEKWF